MVSSLRSVIVAFPGHIHFFSDFILKWYVVCNYYNRLNGAIQMTTHNISVFNGSHASLFVDISNYQWLRLTLFWRI